LIVAPPRTGKTTLLRDIALGAIENHPEIVTMMLLIDERPEEVTDMRRNVPAEVWASSNDEDLQSHLRIADLCIERAKRLVEAGKDVLILLDSITRLARAHNSSRGGGGRTMSGGLDIRALEKPRQLFAAARNTEEAGSLTIIASALIDTGSRMDEMIFQEFKGTGNMEMVLDRKVADMRIWPAVNIAASGTRREELLIEASRLDGIHFFRRAIVPLKVEDAADTAITRLSKTKNNDEFLKLIAR
jgi:transcription termination factor Rho